MLQLVVSPRERSDNRLVKKGVKICLECGSTDTCYNRNGIFCKKCGDTKQYECEKDVCSM